MMKALKPRAGTARPSPEAALAIAQQAAPGQPPATIAAEDRPTTLDWARPRAPSPADETDSPSADPTDYPRVLSVLEAAVAALRDRAEVAERQAEAAERQAEAAERARDAEQSRAEQAERARDAERGRADALRTRIDELLAQLAAAEAEAEQARAQAEDAAQVVDAMTNAMTADTAARRARGLTARLRAAWRGD